MSELGPCDMCDKQATVQTMDFDLCDEHASALRAKYRARERKKYEQPGDEYLRNQIKEK